MKTSDNFRSQPLAVWAGAEYTCNRVGSIYFDQMKLSGHAARLRDVELFAELGVHSLRSGVLWERQEAEGWRWADEYLGAVSSAGLRPITGLVHHGSGPPHTDLLDSAFPEKLAAYAGEVAARYPWLEAYTPVNEPLTTARFACRYGLWYPHQSSQSKFIRALLNQIKGTVLSMRAIRAVHSDAKLVQTEDLGSTWSTAELSFQSQLFNVRRWLSFDLLCGQVDRLHPMYSYLRASGCTDDEIFWFRDNPCPPDVIGVNYYVTSDRYLDHRTERYPETYRSAEGRFCDLSAVRVCADGIQGFEAILVEADQRYGLPVAITEVHLGDRVDEQIRWAAEAWEAAQRAKCAGVPCEAVTFWALLGSYFWNNLVTSDNGYYESGVFDLRSGEPTATELATIVKQCAASGVLSHPALASSGWWRLPERLEYELVDTNASRPVLCSANG